MPEITLLYAGILGVMSVAVSFPAGRLRGKTGISIGDGGNRELLLAMRRHTNFAEAVPIALIVFALLEMRGAPGVAIHIMAGGLVLFRICHAFGIKADTVKSIGRAVGAGGTALVTMVASVWAIVAYF